MTGIVLCEISSGLAIEPSRMPDGVTGDDTPVIFVTTGAVGDVEFGFAPPGYVANESPLPPGRTLTDNGDGTATVSDTFDSAGEGYFYLYAWDEAGQIAYIKNKVSVKWSVEPYVRSRADIPSDGTQAKYELVGGPSLGIGVVVDFDPALPVGWSTTEANNGHLVTVNLGSGTWHGTVGFTFVEGWPAPAPRRVSAEKTLSKPDPL